MGRLAGVIAVASVTAAESTKVTPLEKVTELIQGLIAEVKADGKKEAATYDEFACFCKGKTGSLATAIKGGKQTIETQSAELEEKTQTKADKAEEAEDTKKKKEELHKELDEETARCSRLAAGHQANKADIDKAISSLQKAIKSMTDAKPKTASLLAARVTVEQTVELAEAMKIVDEGMPSWTSAQAFIQESSRIDPSNPMYKYHSQDLVDLMNEMLADFQKRKANLDTEYAKAKAGCVDMKSSLNKRIDDAKTSISTLQTDGEKLASEIGDARRTIVETSDQLEDDQLYLKDLTKMCEARAVDWDQRSTARGEELNALGKVLDLLTEDVSRADKVNERALLQSNASSVLSFVQKSSVAKVSLHRSSAAAPTEADDGRNRALAALQEASSRLKSPTLAMLALKVSADPFGKVKELMQKLIERLVHEATQEATKKGFCDTELGKAKKDREFRAAEVDKIDSEIAVLEVKEDQLTLDIEKLAKDLKKLTADLKEATDIRTKEKAENAKTIKTAKEGAKAVYEAIMIMKSFYNDAKGASLLQVAASPVAEDTSGPGFEGGYEGKQTAANGIISMLEVIQSDFKRTVMTTTKEEKAAAAEFVEFDRATKADISGKETKSKLNADDLDMTKATIKVKYEDLQSNQNLLDDALKQLEELHPLCVDSGMSYEERVAKREEEIKALKKAFCLLDTDNVESDCA